MILSPELIKHAKNEVNIQQYFIQSETCTPKHLLFQQFIEHTKWKGLPKLIFYILMDETFPKSISKATDGNLGYCLELVVTPIEIISDSSDQPNQPH